MRWLIVLVCVVAGSGVADAKLVIRDPPMVVKCPIGKTFAAITTCLAKHVTATVVRQLPNARLVRITESNRAGARVDAGVLLYVLKRDAWRISGYYRAYGTYEVLAFEALTIEKHRGYRIELGTSTPIHVMLDVSAVSALLRTRRSLYCGNDYRCAEATTLCEALVHGHAVFAFHGKISIADSTIAITGDRSRAGAQCNVAARVFLGWSDL